MKQQNQIILLTLAYLYSLVCSCTRNIAANDEVLFDFVYVGCNRVTHHDKNNSNTDASRANLAQLKKIYTELSQIKNPPKYFFFLGDMVLGQKDTATLRSELQQWVKDFRDTATGGINHVWNPRIKLIAVPGNHELLTELPSPPYTESPLNGAISVWMDEMKGFFPDSLTRDTGLVNQATYSFHYANTFFLVMNTDTYNDNGINGQIPLDWIKNQMNLATTDKSIDHILLLGHKPAFYSREGKFVRDFDGAESIVQSQTEQLWPEMQKNKVAAMLSAHVHTYDRFQPQGNGSYQVIAGNAGSLKDENKTGDCGKAPDFFGYSHVYVMKSGKLIHVSRGWKIDACNYLQPVPNNIKTCTYDSLEIQWGTNNGSWTLSDGINCR